MKSWQQNNMFNKPSSRTSLKTKTSLRDVKIRNEGTQHSQVCSSRNSFTSNQSKKSLRDLNGYLKLTPTHIQHYTSMSYSDIKIPVLKKNSFFLGIFCASKQKYEVQGCLCQPKCIWIDHWLSLCGNMLLPESNFPITRQIDGEIRRDILRTQPNYKQFHNINYQQALYKCLVAYAQADPEISYVQGMNLICSVLIYHGSNVLQCIHLFKYLMITCGFRNLLKQNFLLSKKLSQWLKQCLRHRCNDLYRHMVQYCGLNVQMFSVGWLIPMMGNIIPLTQMHFVMNTFMEKGWTGLIKILLTMFLYLKEQILAIQDEGELMEILCTEKIKKRQINWQQVIQSSSNIKNLPAFL